MNAVKSIQELPKSAGRELITDFPDNSNFTNVDHNPKVGVTGTLQFVNVTELIGNVFTRFGFCERSMFVKVTTETEGGRTNDGGIVGGISESKVMV